MTQLTQNDPGFYSAGGWGYRETDRPISAIRLTRWLDDSGIPRGGSALDAGCGDGWWSSLLEAEGFDVTGIDRSADAIKTAKRQWPGPTYRRLELNDVTGTYDLIFARGLFATVEVFETLGRLLADDGRIVYVRSTDGTGIVSPGVIGTPAANPTLAEMADAINGAGLLIYQQSFEHNEAVYGVRNP